MATYETFTLKNAKLDEVAGHFGEVCNTDDCNFGRKRWGSVYRALNFSEKQFATEKEADEHVREKAHEHRYDAWAAQFGKNGWVVGAVCRD
jgi:hypothetical protein